MEVTLDALFVVLQPLNVLLLVAGLLLGGIFGILPGVSVLTAVVLVLPLTYSLTGEGSIILLMGIYVAGIFSGAFTSILFNIPGDPQNTPTTIDGYPMTRKGEAAKAIGATVISSAIGGLFGALVLILVSRELARVSLIFGPAEYFSLTILGLTMVTVLGGGSYAKMLLSVLAGLLLATVGVAEVSGESRLKFGFAAVNAGFHFVPIVIGALAMSEVFEAAATGLDISRQYAGQPLRMREGIPSRRELADMIPTWLRCAPIATIIGVLPGHGATFAAFACYGIERTFHRRRAYFGTGEIAGVAAPEVAGNAAGMGTLVPLLALGIPGGGVAAVMLGAMQIHGLQPGPLMFTNQPRMVMVIFITALIANAMILAIGPWLARYIVRLLRIPAYLMLPAIATLCVVGAYAANNDIFDVWVMLASGLVGTYLRTQGYSVISLVLGVLLGPIAEGAFVQGMILFGSPLGFFNGWISSVLLVLSAIFVIAPLAAALLRRLRGASQTLAEPRS
jgi:putative tricarboxylic transport membrane protein